MDQSTKPTNPKDAVGIRKVPMSCLPAEVLGEVAVGMMEGARKYGRHNYRVPALGVRASVYYDATMRHLMSWWEGEDVDPDSSLSHITKAITSLVVLRDAMIQENYNDDRPPKSPEGWMAALNERAGLLVDKYPDAVQAYTETGDATNVSLRMPPRASTYAGPVCQASGEVQDRDSGSPSLLWGELL